MPVHLVEVEIDHQVMAPKQALAASQEGSQTQVVVATIGATPSDFACLGPSFQH